MKTNLQPLLNDTNGTNIKLRFVKLINYYLNQTKAQEQAQQQAQIIHKNRKKTASNLKKARKKNTMNSPLDESGDSNQPLENMRQNHSCPLICYYLRFSTAKILKNIFNLRFTSHPDNTRKRTKSGAVI